MGGGDLQGNIAFSLNPQVTFPTSGGATSSFPNLTKSDLQQWFVDVSNGPYPGFTEASLNSIDKFEGGWEVIGNDAFNFTNLKLNVKDNQNLTDIFEEPGSLKEIQDRSFYRLGLDGGLGFSGSFTDLSYIGANSFEENKFTRGVSIRDLPNLTKIGTSAFYKCIENGPITLSNLPNLTQLSFTFQDNSSNSKLTLEKLPKLSIIDFYTFFNSGISGDVTISGLEELETIENTAFGSSNPEKAAQIKSVEFVNLPKLDTIGNLNNYNPLVPSNTLYSFGTENLILKNLPAYTDDASLSELKFNLGVNNGNDSSFTGDLTLEGLPGLTYIQDFSGFARNFTGKLTIKDCSNLTEIKEAAFKDCNFTQINFTSISGSVVYQDVFPQLDGISSEQPNVLVWKNSSPGFTIPDNKQYLWNVPTSSNSSSGMAANSSTMNFP